MGSRFSDWLALKVLGVTPKENTGESGNMQLRSLFHIIGFAFLGVAILLFMGALGQETLVTNFAVMGVIAGSGFLVAACAVMGVIAGSGFLVAACVVMSAVEIVFSLRKVVVQLEANAENNERLARALAKTIEKEK